MVGSAPKGSLRTSASTQTVPEAKVDSLKPEASIVSEVVFPGDARPAENPSRKEGRSLDCPWRTETLNKGGTERGATKLSRETSGAAGKLHGCHADSAVSAAGEAGSSYGS